MPKRRQSPTIASTRCTTRCIARTCWPTPTRCCRANDGRTGSGRPDVRGHRGVRRGAVAGRTGGRTEEEDVSAASRPAGVDSEAGRQAAAVGHSDDPRPRGADGGGAGLGADLRGRPAAGAIRLPAGRSALDAVAQVHSAGPHGAYGGGRCGPERVLRQHPARRTDEVGGPAGQRPARAASDQDVAGWRRSKKPTSGAARSERPATRTRGEAPRKARRSRRCWRISTCGGSCWAGRRWDTSSASAHASSTMPTTS